MVKIVTRWSKLRNSGIYNLSGQIRLVKINHYNQNTLFGELAIQVGQQNSENAA